VPRVRRDKLVDLAAVSPLILFYAFAVAGVSLGIMRRAEVAPLSGALVLWLASQAALIGFFGLQIVLFVVRRAAVAKARGWLPRAMGLAGLYATMPLLMLPLVALGGTGLAVSTALGIAGLAASIYVMIWLGRAFSIFPQARGLVTQGPYRVIRHPLYLTEFVAALGLMLQFAQPWALLIVLAGFAIQIVRMHYEEAILSRVFPGYADYAKRTARLVPGIY
jgi:protein-S-isoprenylcysteine O-methyltransferase Ste14